MSNPYDEEVDSIEPARQRFDGLNPINTWAKQMPPEPAIGTAPPEANIGPVSITNPRDRTQMLHYESILHPNVVDRIRTSLNHSLNRNYDNNVFIEQQIRRIGPEFQWKIQRLPVERRATAVFKLLETHLRNASKNIFPAVTPHDTDHYAATELQSLRQREVPNPVRPMTQTTNATSGVTSVQGFSNPHLYGASLQSGFRGFRTPFLLDSMNRDPNTETSLYRWEIAVDNNRNRQGAYAPSRIPQNIRRVRIISMSIPSTGDSQTEFGELDIEIPQLATQGYNSATTTIQFTGLIDSSVLASRLDVDFSKRVDVVDVNPPKTNFDDIAFRLHNSDGPIDFFTERVLVNTVTPGPTTTFTFRTEVPDSFANTNDLVQIVGLTTDQPVMDSALVSQLVQPAGHRVLTADKQSVEIEFDSSGLIGTIATGIELYNKAKRIIMRLEIEHIEISTVTS